MVIRFRLICAWDWQHPVSLTQDRMWQYEERGAGSTGGSRPSDKGGGGRSSRAWNRGGGKSLKKYFSALRASVWSKNRGAWPPRFSPLDPPLGSGEVRRTREQTLTWTRGVTIAFPQCIEIPSILSHRSWSHQFKPALVSARSRWLEVTENLANRTFWLNGKRPSFPILCRFLFLFFTSLSLLPVPRFSNIPPRCSVKYLSYVSSVGRPFWTFRRFPH